MASRAARTLMPAAHRRGVAPPAWPGTKKAGFSTTHGVAWQAPPKARKEKADLVPVCVSLGLIATSVTLGLYAARHQLLYAPDVCVSKRRRETIPEVDDPDSTAAETDKFLSRSIFRRIAHLRDFHQTPDPLRPGSRLYHPGRLEDLRTVGVEPRTS